MHTPSPTLRLAALFDAGREALIARYGHRLRAHQHRAMNAIVACRSGACGCLDWRCPDCAQRRETTRSCGHRSCPQCQNHTTTDWLERLRDKLLPVDYFMVTFTLPAGLRAVAQAQPHAVYSALFCAASATLKGFGERKLKAELGQCAVLHTHNRRLDLHPHVHVVVPGDGIDSRRKQWRKIQGKFLFNAFALARVFRAIEHSLNDSTATQTRRSAPSTAKLCPRLLTHSRQPASRQSTAKARIAFPLACFGVVGSTQ